MDSGEGTSRRLYAAFAAAGTRGIHRRLLKNDHILRSHYSMMPHRRIYLGGLADGAGTQCHFLKVGAPHGHLNDLRSHIGRKPSHLECLRDEVKAKAALYSAYRITLALGPCVYLTYALVYDILEPP
ncbi:hypothetical protein PENSPDRAFT_649959 [Peniophora sp. CONT]|nr:hypothetical protein PENSPDRAFT_649959 [Peniophora sp. CONT]